MKKNVLLLFFTAFVVTNLHAQNYANIVNYNLNGTPAHGVKIKTNIPFSHGVGMPTIKIEGYNYVDRTTSPYLEAKFLNVHVAWYPYNGEFITPVAASYGGSNPNIYLGAENGKIYIYIDQKIYYQRLTVSAFALDKGELPQYFKDWTVVDEPKPSSGLAQCVYKNNFAGNVGIGTDEPKSKLDVRGKVIADEVEIKVNKGADFVFAADYKLPTLSEVETFVKTNEHLPEIPSEKEMQEKGINIGDIQMKLLQKIEELTLYTIQQQKQLDEQQKLIETQGKLIEELQKR